MRDQDGLDKVCYSKEGEKWTNIGSILEVQKIGLERVKERQTGNDSHISSLDNCIDGYNVMSEMEKNRNAYLGKETKSSILVIQDEVPIRYMKRSYPVDCQEPESSEGRTREVKLGVGHRDGIQEGNTNEKSLQDQTLTHSNFERLSKGGKGSKEN